MVYAILRDRVAKEPIVVAVVALEGQQLRVMANSKLLIALLENIFSFPVRVKERTPEGVFKRPPKTVAENLEASLKAKLFYPYRIGNSREAASLANVLKYKKVYPTNILYGEARHEQPTGATAQSA